MESVAVEPGNGASVAVAVHGNATNQDTNESDNTTHQGPTPSPSQSRSQSQSPVHKGASDPTVSSSKTLNPSPNVGLGGIALDLSTTMDLSRRLVPSEVTTQCPLLLGSYRVDENGVALWTGRWAMTEAEYATGITSLFEMYSSKPLSSTRLLHHNQSDPLNNLQGESATDEDENRASPVPAEKVMTAKGECPIERKFDGFFQILTVKGKPATIPEKDVLLTFQKCDIDNVFTVRGTGENRFGVFTLQGVLDEASQELRLYKAYKPKDKTPVAKRTRPKDPPRSTMEPSVKLEKVEKTPKKQKVKIEKAEKFESINPAEMTTTLAAPVAVDFTHVSKAFGMPTNGTSSSSYDRPSSSNSSRHRSERKRSLPAHLREEGLAELERMPAMRKCHNILKNLVGNAKAVPFLIPVDPVALGIPDYFKVIKEPMDLGTVRGNLENGVYPDPYSFAEHVRLVFNNAMRYNAAHTQVHVFAQKLLEEFEKKIKAVFKSDSNMMFKGSKRDRKVFGSLSDDEGSQDSSSGPKSKSVKPGKLVKRSSSSKNQEINNLKEEIEKMKVMVQEMVSNKGTPPIGTPLGSKPRQSRPFRMQDLTEEQLTKPMTVNEKHKLTNDLKALPEEKISRVLQIIAEIVPLHTITQGDDEVELDLNMFDTRSLRMMEGYLREHNVTKRKRPPKKTAAKESDRLQMAKESAEAVKSRQEELQRKLAAIENGGAIPPSSLSSMTEDVRTKLDGEKSSDSSSSESGSSDSESSDSDSDTEQPLQKSPSLVSAPALHSSSELSRSTVVEDEPTNEPLKVENRGAWTKLARLESTDPVVASTAQRSPIQSDENSSSSLWLFARTMEQQKLQKEQLKDTQQAEEVAQQKMKDMEDRVKEKEREREEMERLKLEQEAALKQAREDRQREMELTLAAMRVEEREKLKREIAEDMVVDDCVFRDDLALFGSATFY
ncbi:Aste57867_15482 [Aphanomyces stellatus]|uniref:Aste57867_15482 protein n=1 Tax=Aphanomyces stellatus TaxID=120398 RepID=A0A485L658_9STRA|nr:hypothetical protein As57867_015426 [Aphanomyces stellatus]VFT92284.1 Aste57867_15482 [Aphanomyces stellatus]